MQMILKVYQNLIIKKIKEVINMKYILNIKDSNNCCSKMMTSKAETLRSQIGKALQKLFKNEAETITIDIIKVKKLE